MSGGFLCFPDELLNSAVHDAAGGKPRITPFAYMIIRDATATQAVTGRDPIKWVIMSVLTQNYIATN
jgi:hypothetical protein